MYTLNVHATIIHIIITINDNFNPSLLKVSVKYHSSQCLLLLPARLNNFQLLSMSASDEETLSSPLLLAKTRAVSPLLFLIKVN